MNCTPCAFQKPHLSVQAFCTRPSLRCRGANSCQPAKSAYLGQRLVSQRLGTLHVYMFFERTVCQQTRQAILGTQSSRLLLVET